MVWITDRPAMTIAVDLGLKAAKETNGRIVVVALGPVGCDTLLF